MTNLISMSEFQRFVEEVAGRQRVHLAMQGRLDGSSLSVPITVLRGPQPGPTMVLVSGQHGNEWNGPWILRQLAASLDPADLLGTVIAIPIANTLAFNEGMRVSSVDRVDMNRTYLGGVSRKPTEYLAEGLWKTIFSKADYLIDIHSGGPGVYLPFTATPGGKHLDLARSLNLPFIHTPEPGKNGFLVNACQENGIAALLIEVGGGHSLDREHHRPVQEGLVNLMRRVGTYSGSPTAGGDPRIFTEKTIVPAPAAGFFLSQVQLGQELVQGDMLGEIFPVLGDDALQITTPRAGVVLYLRRAPLLSEKASLVHLV